MKLYIVNETDKPCHRCIAELRDDGKLHYIHPCLQGWPGMDPREATPLHDFGVGVTIDGKQLRGEVTGVSRATYGDGRLRSWQGEDEFVIDLP